jgi:Raf kinase inhibitor-like YbhB/YbcL family protein
MNVRNSCRIALAVPLLASVLTGCKTGTDLQLAQQQLLVPALVSGGTAKALRVSSSAFAEGAPIPAKHSADGGNVSPALQWSGAPSTTKEFVLIVEDPDAPTPKPFAHWVAFRIPAGAAALPEDSGSNALVGQGANSNGGAGYFGPKPPPGKPHRYFFQLFALNAPLALEDGASREDVVKAMRGKVVGAGSVVGTFKTGK